MENRRSSGSSSSFRRILAGPSKAARITRKQAGPTDVTKFEEEHDHTFETNTSSTVLRTS
jgi:hypothetical protein